MDTIYMNQALSETMARGARRILASQPRHLANNDKNDKNRNNKNDDKDEDKDEDDDRKEPQEQQPDEIVEKAINLVEVNNNDEVKEVPSEATATTQENEYEPTQEQGKEEEANTNQDEQQPRPVSTSNNNQDEPTTETSIDLIKLVPFDVKIVSSNQDGAKVNSFALTDLVTDWMDDALQLQLDFLGWDETTHSVLDSVLLEERSISDVIMSNSDDNGERRWLRGSARQLQVAYTIASYEGVTLWKHTEPQEAVTAEDVETMERQVLLRDDRLLEILQSSAAEGLGSSITDVRAYINPHPVVAGDATLPGGSSATLGGFGASANANLELIIVIAIAVACMAFAFLIFSLFWAWRFDQQRRKRNQDEAGTIGAIGTPDAPIKNGKGSPDGTGVTDESDYEFDRIQHMDMDINAPNQSKSSSKTRNVQQFQAQVEPKSNKNDDDESENYTLPSNLGGGGLYPESVISEDISTSLSAYYRSGMGRPPVRASGTSITASAIVDSGSITLGGRYNSSDFDDQASFSSMESYGYSLDGYAPSLSGNTLQNNPSNLAAPSSVSDPDDGLDDIIKKR